MNSPKEKDINPHYLNISDKTKHISKFVSPREMFVVDKMIETREIGKNDLSEEAGLKEVEQLERFALVLGTMYLPNAEIDDRIETGIQRYEYLTSRGNDLNTYQDWADHLSHYSKENPLIKQHLSDFNKYKNDPKNDDLYLEFKKSELFLARQNNADTIEHGINILNSMLNKQIGSSYIESYIIFEPVLKLNKTMLDSVFNKGDYISNIINKNLKNESDINNVFYETSLLSVDKAIRDISDIFNKKSNFERMPKETINKKSLHLNNISEKYETLIGKNEVSDKAYEISKNMTRQKDTKINFSM